MRRTRRPKPKRTAVATAARTCLLCVALFGFAAALGAGFAVFGPVAFVRVLGGIAFAAGTAGAALQIYALRELAPRAHVLLQRRIRGGFRHVTVPMAVTPTVLPIELGGHDSRS